MSWRNLSLAVLEKQWLKLSGRPFACVLMYHSVGHNGRFFNVTPDMFEKQMAFLKRSGVRVVGLRALVKGLMNDRVGKCVVITFDDGYADLYETALPVLKKYGFLSTVFLSTGLIGRDFKGLPLLSWEQVKKMKKTGLFEFEPHGHNHRKLDGLGLDEVSREIMLSRDAVKRELGTSSLFAYPSGKYTKDVVNAVRRAGLKGAVTVRQGYVFDKTPLLEIPRVSIDSSTPLKFFEWVIP